MYHLDNLFFNVLTVLFTFTGMCVFLYAIINIALLYLIIHRFLKLNNNQVIKSVKVDEVYQNFLIKYTYLLNIKLPMCVIIFMKLFNTCTFFNFSIGTTLILLVLYLLSTELTIKGIFYAWLFIIKLNNAIGENSNILSQSDESYDSNNFLSETEIFEVYNREIQDYKQNLQDYINKMALQGLQPADDSIYEEINSLHKIYPDSIDFNTTDLSKNKISNTMMKGLLNTGLLVNTSSLFRNPINSTRFYSTYKDSRSFIIENLKNTDYKDNLLDVALPAATTSDASNFSMQNPTSRQLFRHENKNEIDRMKNNGIFFNFEKWTVQTPSSSIKGAVDYAIDKFTREMLKDIWKEYGAASLQIRVDLPELGSPSYRSFTEYCTVTEFSYKKWKDYVDFQVNSKTLNYSSICPSLSNGSGSNLTVTIMYSEIRWEISGSTDRLISVAGYFDSPTDFDKPSRWNNLVDPNLLTKWFTMWPKLLPPVSDFRDVPGAIVKTSRWRPNNLYVSNVMIQNPLITPFHEIAGMSKEELNFVGEEIKKLSASKPNILLESPKFIPVDLEISFINKEAKEVRTETSFCTVYYNDLKICKFIDKDISVTSEKPYEIPLGMSTIDVMGISAADPHKRSTFERTFMNGEKVIIENQVIKRHYAALSPHIFMNKTPPVEWSVVKQIEFGTYDFETRHKRIMDEDPEGRKLSRVSSSGEDQQQLEIISWAIYYNNLWTGKDMAYSRFRLIDDEKDNQETFIQLFLNNVKEVAINALENKNGVERVFHMFAHNASKFDQIFFVKYLIRNLPSEDDIKLIYKDGKFILIDWIVNGKLVKDEMKKQKAKLTHIKFMDSCLMLPSSLEKLAKSFKVQSKGTFDVKNINESTNLNEIYKNLKEYNILDAKILWDILGIHAEQTAKSFHVSIFDCPTAPSLAMKVFRTNYLNPEHYINISDKATYDILRPAYQGGACDVYNPCSPAGNKIYYYDVNSEYPAMMAKYVMPTGHATKIKGAITWEINSFCGFVLADIECPEDISVPLLARVVKGKTIAGAGSWTGWYYAAELRYALTLGYKVKALEGIQFEGRMVFDKFITDLYDKRLKYDKSNSMNLILKLIMNSLYGKFGQNPELSEARLINKEDPYDYDVATKFHDIQLISETRALVVSSNVKNTELNYDHPGRNLQISLPIAAAITAQARINIHNIKMEASKLGVLLYSDTDSVVCSKPLPKEMLGKGLGLLKLEYTADKGIFLAPKVYAMKNVYSGDQPIGDIIKAKGLRNVEGLSFETYEKLLNIDNYYKSFQTKWFRSHTDASIVIKDLVNVMKVTTGKRVIVTNINGIFESTSNVIFKDGDIVSPEIIKNEQRGIVPILEDIFKINLYKAVNRLPVLYTLVVRLPVLYKAVNRLPVLYTLVVRLPVLYTLVVRLPVLFKNVSRLPVLYKSKMVAPTAIILYIEEMKAFDIIRLYPPKTRFDWKGYPIIKNIYLNIPYRNILYKNIKRKPLK